MQVKYIGYIGDVRQMIDIREFAYISSDRSVYEISLEDLSFKEIVSFENGDLMIGSDENRLVICSWENFVKNNIDEIATLVKITDKDGQSITHYEFKETVRPIECQKVPQYYTDNYPNSPERQYKLGDLSLTLNTEKLPDNEEPYEVKDLPMINYPIKKVLSYWDSQIIVDNYNYIWLIE